MNKTLVQIKQMKQSDLPEVLLLWEKAGLDITSPEKELLALQNNPNTCFVLTKDEKIIGAVLGAFNGRRAWVYHLSIHPAYQHMGYGSLLLKKVESELKKKGAYRIHLGVAFTNLKVLPFYENHGYSVVNDALWMGNL